MASTYSDLKIELIGTGEQVGTWGATTNTNLGTALGEAITGSANVSFSSADVTLTLTNTNGSQTARNLRLVCTGTSGGARQLILGSGCQIEKLYLVQNDLADAVTIKNTTGTGVTIPAGGRQFVFNNGTNVIQATTASIINLTTDVTGILPVVNGGTGAATLTGVLKGNGTSPVTASNVNLASEVTGTLPIANGGTGSTSTTFCNLTTNVTGTLPVANGGTGAASLTANNVLLGNGTSAVQVVAPGANGNALISNGTTWTSTAIPAPPAPAALSTASGAAPSYSARAWVNFDGTGAVSIRSSGNVSSITDNGVGRYFVNFSTSLPDSDYAIAGCANRGINFNNCTVVRGSGTGTDSSSSSGAEISCVTGTVIDCVAVQVTCFR